jgi:hypothetical protein
MVHAMNGLGGLALVLVDGVRNIILAGSRVSIALERSLGYGDSVGEVCGGLALLVAQPRMERELTFGGCRIPGSTFSVWRPRRTRRWRG